jgi:serine protease Do
LKKLKTLTFGISIFLFGAICGCDTKGLGDYFVGSHESPLRHDPYVDKAADLQDCFAEIYDLYYSRVVYISTEQVIKLPKLSFYDTLGIQTENKRTGLGSGFIISEDGFVLTNLHIVTPHGIPVDKIAVVVDNVAYKAEIRGYDSHLDIAVLKINSNKRFNPVYFGDSDSLRVGDWAIAIGNPFGFSQTFTVGTISATARKDVTFDRETYIQTDTAINPGNSGGPLINIRGEVVGINRMIYSEDGGYIGIGFAIPINQVKAVIEKLKEGKSITRGYIGALMTPMIKEIARILDWKYDSGFLVQSVAPNGPADKAGIRNGDILFAMNGSEIHDANILLSIIENTQPGTKVEFSGWRYGQTLKFVVKIGEKR